ncbi:MAG: carboxymuconolactone decarboxylase family protein [Nitrospinota bacterium]
MDDLPPSLQAFQKAQPRVWAAYSEMAEACSRAGPLDRKTASLIKTGISAAARKRTSLATNIRRALEAGASREEIEHAIVLTATTQGFSTMMEAMAVCRSAFEAAGGSG